MNFRSASFVLLFAVVFAGRAGFGAEGEGAGIQGTNQQQRYTVGILAFKNATGDPSLDHWSHGFAEMLGGRLVWARHLRVIEWNALSPALTNAGWRPDRAIDAGYAGQLARDLTLDAVLWGNFSKKAEEWTLEVHAFRRSATNAPVVMQFKESSMGELLIHTTLELAPRLGGQVPADVPEKWRRRSKGSASAWDRLARALSLERTGAPPEAREKILRQIMTDEAQFAPARTLVAQLLLMQGKKAEAEPEVRALLAQIPDWCHAHLMMASLNWMADKDAAAENELREALRNHPGCPGACQGLYQMLRRTDRWKELREILERGNADFPGETATKAFLAATRAHCDDVEGAQKLLHELPGLEWESLAVHAAVMEAAASSQLLSSAAREIHWMQKDALSNTNAASLLADIDKGFFVKQAKALPAPVVRPRSYTSDELAAALRERLTPEERALAVNPLELTPEIAALAKDLTRGVTNQALKALLLFDEVVQRGRGKGAGSIRTAAKALEDSNDPQTRLSCQEFAKLFVTLARAAGLEAWLAHVEVDENGNAGDHDCAALFLGDLGFLSDPTWAELVAGHKQFRVLDDVQAIAHQAMQMPNEDNPDVTRLRMGRKLDPDDVWTRLRLVFGLSRAGTPGEAEAELGKLGTNHLARWDYHYAVAAIAASHQRWQPALTALQQALTLSPSNAIVHLQLAHVYNESGNYGKSKEHAEVAVRLATSQGMLEGKPEDRVRLTLIGALAQGQTNGAQGLATLRQRAEAGEAAAQFALAKLLLESKPPQLEEAIEWLRKAAESGDDEFQRNYAFNLIALRGPAAEPEAIRWFTRSAEQGNREAQYLLGWVLYDGKVAPHDYVAACQWMILAANGGHKEARSLLKEMEIMVDKTQLVEGRRRAREFKAKPREEKAR